MDRPGFLRSHAADMEAKKRLFDSKVQQHKAKQSQNPFSGHHTQAVKLSKDNPNYGKPVAGSLAEKRGKKAAALINSEVALLCDMIYQEGEKYDDNTAAISFGNLFQIYTRISSKVVGLLLRARKYGLLDFEGEMLFQRRDDHVPIVLLKPIQEIKAEMAKDVEFEVGICHKNPKID